MARIAVIVGTVYGGAQYVAEQAEPLLQQYGHQVQIFDEPVLDNVSGFQPDIWLVITSTTGQGDIPDNLLPFFLETRERFPLLTGKRYAVIAMGDRSYGDTFCGSGRQFAELLAELQGSAIAPMLEIDACETLQAEEAALPWLEQHFSQL
ncbi:flavodoxin [Chromatiaceae bacterium AAb-1]|nr:flavodoxin [Chromatiaceae bacterium AAb-1]